MFSLVSATYCFQIQEQESKSNPGEGVLRELIHEIMDLANELFRAERSQSTPPYATRGTTNLPYRTITDQYKDLMAANRIPEERRGSSSSMVWDEFDLRQAQAEPEFEEVHEENAVSYTHLTLPTNREV